MFLKAPIVCLTLIYALTAHAFIGNFSGNSEHVVPVKTNLIALKENQILIQGKVATIKGCDTCKTYQMKLTQSTTLENKTPYRVISQIGVLSTPTINTYKIEAESSSINNLRTKTAIHDLFFINNEDLPVKCWRETFEPSEDKKFSTQSTAHIIDFHQQFCGLHNYGFSMDLPLKIANTWQIDETSTINMEISAIVKDLKANAPKGLMLISTNLNQVGPYYFNGSHEKQVKLKLHELNIPITRSAMQALLKATRERIMYCGISEHTVSGARELHMELKKIEALYKALIQEKPHQFYAEKDENIYFLHAQQRQELKPLLGMIEDYIKKISDMC